MKADEIKNITLQAKQAIYSPPGGWQGHSDSTRDHVAVPPQGRILFAWDSKGKPHYIDAALVTDIPGISANT